MSWENVMKTDWKDYQGYSANKPELELLHKNITAFLKKERPSHPKDRAEEMAYNDNLRKTLMEALKLIEAQLNY
jgi:hypothetical protein